MTWDVEMNLGSFLLLQTPGRQAQLPLTPRLSLEALSSAAPKGRDRRLRGASATRSPSPGTAARWAEEHLGQRRGPGPSCPRGCAASLRPPGMVPLPQQERGAPRTPLWLTMAPLCPGAAPAPLAAARARSDLRRGASGPAALATAPPGWHSVSREAGSPVGCWDM